MCQYILGNNCGMLQARAQTFGRDLRLHPIVMAGRKRSSLCGWMAVCGMVRLWLCVRRSVCRALSIWVCEPFIKSFQVTITLPRELVQCIRNAYADAFCTGILVCSGPTSDQNTRELWSILSTRLCSYTSPARFLIPLGLIKRLLLERKQSTINSLVI